MGIYKEKILKKVFKSIWKPDINFLQKLLLTNKILFKKLYNICTSLIQP